VAVRFLHEYYGVSVEMAMEWRSSGGKLEDLTAREYRNRHVKGRKADEKAEDHTDAEPASNRGGKGKGRGPS